jgi:3-hydroxyisobutyrate dehydrogenase-like beta-hydroxyacid dehydrogenase
MQSGFLGLGAMGRPIARNLLKAGHQVIVYNRTRSRAEKLTADGAQVSDVPGIRADIVLTILADDHAVEAVAFDGLLDALPRGCVHVDEHHQHCDDLWYQTPAHVERFSASALPLLLVEFESRSA